MFGTYVAKENCSHYDRPVLALGPCWALPDLRQDVEINSFPSLIPSLCDLSGHNYVQSMCLCVDERTVMT